MYFSSVSCGVGTFYSGEQEQCVQCPPGTYQDTVGQLSCEPCPSTEGQGIAGAKNVSQCGGNSLSHFSSLILRLFPFYNVRKSGKLQSVGLASPRCHYSKLNLSCITDNTCDF